ncbi:MAG: DUF5615 family PIN-like protein [Candidatus Nanohaloarchaea archaeon]|nr:DUF5615 family PIN-like protein [Candidatus Nanohaloarchaea archaeon]
MSDPKFLADEHIDRPSVESLKKKGIDIEIVQDIGKKGSPDREILKYAKRQDRVIISRDADFLVLDQEGKDHAGIIFLARPLDIGDIIRQVEKIHLLYDGEELEDRVVFLPL